ncbi:clp protease family protein [Wolbachia endosymbiont of Drosophila ananassae]|nr:peptidase S49 family protein [Wolbachia endosymbiont of Drosophila ananassae]QEF50694.1 clp protease family protein [Wolbachia endosymbiont of Drosophila ananassae]RLT60021.1 clp protease family protein [Wolbachia endosymbiont of Drosophila ananassae]RLT61854.1 clp protease family protein [Wolbachia endosymbiont of Drosophila ananassae]
MVEPRSFELLSLQTGKQPIFKNIKHAVRNSERGIIPIHGILTKKSEVFDDVLGMTSYEKISEEIEEALIDKEVETIILDIDSPGGEVNGLFDLSDFIYQARRKKRIVAIANDDAYSAAYAIASSAEKVLVTRTSGVGSIGVIASHIDQSGFDEKQGIKYTTVFAGSRKNDLNPHEPITSESLESLKSEVNRLYGMLVELIARNRNLSVEAIKSTEAGLYFGEKAVEIGLADGITILSEFKSINKKGDITMNEKTTNDLETDNLTKYRTEVLELIRLCNLSRMPEKIGEFIEQSVSVEQAREVLMELLAERTKKTEILSAIPQNSGEELMMQVAKSRAQSNI